MIDYKLLNAFAKVIEHGSFEKAAAVLGLTQSAVSQRVKLLESRIGEQVIVRGNPLSATEIGKSLLNHQAKVSLLEAELSSELSLAVAEQQRVRIAVNADSISCWWFPAVKEYFLKHDLLVEIVIEDQNYGLERMKQGEVSASICTSPTPLQGARAVYIGNLECGVYSSPVFAARYFPNGLDELSVAIAPAVIYGKKDDLHDDLLRDLNIKTHYPFHICPSTQGIEQLILADMAYGVLSVAQAKLNMDAGNCVRLATIEQTPSMNIPLYWHYWRQGASIFEKLIPYMKRGL